MMKTCHQSVQGVRKYKNSSETKLKDISNILEPLKSLKIEDINETLPLISNILKPKKKKKKILRSEDNEIFPLQIEYSSQQCGTVKRTENEFPYLLLTISAQLLQIHQGSFITVLSILDQKGSNSVLHFGSVFLLISVFHGFFILKFSLYVLLPITNLIYVI